LPVSHRQTQPRHLSAEDESLEDSANFPNPDTIAQEIVEDLQAAFAPFAEIANDLNNVKWTEMGMGSNLKGVLPKSEVFKIK
jgi:hypothetical protein